MLGIKPPWRSSNPQPEIATLRAPAPPGMPDREKIQVAVDSKNILRTIEVFFAVAESNGIRQPEVSVGKPYLLQQVRSAKKLLPLSLRFCPDLADGTFSPTHLENVNRVGPHIHRALRNARIADYSPID